MIALYVWAAPFNIGVVSLGLILVKCISIMRVAFLYNHSTAHQVPHTAPYAFALSCRHAGLEVVLAYSSAAERTMLERIAEKYPDHRCIFHALAVPALYQLVDPLISVITFEKKKQVLRHNLDFFLDCDALVTPELTSLRLKRVHGLNHLQMILVPHGAGDRAESYDPRIAEFDHVLVPGWKTFERMLKEGCVRKRDASVVGYAKFEALSGRLGHRFFDNDKPTVLYNPHFEPRLSSWQRHGRAVLNYFISQREFNLIFAPHILLFRRFLRHRAWLPRLSIPDHVLIDCGSERSIDMSYACAADIYLGDASSQVYEFVYHPRPCIFLNSQGVDWRQDPNYAHWHLGEVIESPDQLAGALGRANRLFELRYRAVQVDAAAATFVSPDNGLSVAECGADIIAQQLRAKGVTEQNPLPKEPALSGR